LPRYAPVADLKFVRSRSPLPIFADESVQRAHDVTALAGAVDGVVIKLAKTGGLREALKVIDVARENSMQIMFGCELESSVGISGAVHLSSLVDYVDLDGALLLKEDPYMGPILEDGRLLPSDMPGLGVVPRS